MSLRQRVPFRFSADNEENDEVVLDEQEQEEIIETLRNENTSFNQHYYKFLQGCLSFTIIFNCWFLVSQRQITPIHIFFPNVKTPLPDLIPFATLFTLLNIMVLLNVMLHLPEELSFPRLLHRVISNLITNIPLALDIQENC
ncbi:hypothetical protein K439DRAFT_587503 [Ramaria rubella]|nr:hypothetical protein K439DRAFT_587503 [Ramaria rubella]